VPKRLPVYWALALVPVFYFSPLAISSIIFYPLAFYGFWPNDLLIKVMITNYVLKVTWEVIATPLTYKVVNFLKRKENEDYYDRDTNFTPFSIET
jgi:queuosine precursor transporter